MVHLSYSAIKLCNDENFQQSIEHLENVEGVYIYLSKRWIVKCLKEGEKLLTARGVTEKPNVIPGERDVTGDVVTEVLLQLKWEDKL